MKMRIRLKTEPTGMVPTPCSACGFVFRRPAESDRRMCISCIQGPVYVSKRG